MNFLLTLILAVASVNHGGTYVGSVVVEPGQVVDGDVNVVMGNALIEGRVNGDVNVLGGNIDNRGVVTGHMNAVGGEVVQSIVPWAPGTSGWAPDAPDYHLWWRIAWDVVVLVVFLIFPVRTRMALARLEQHPAIATFGGLCGWVAVLPVAVLLCITLVLIPLIPVEFVLLAVAVFIGKAALALLIGRRFYELLQPAVTPSPLLALVIGLVLLTAAELVPVAGYMFTGLIMLVGLGAVLLTFIPETTVPPGIPRSPIGGPPMPVG